jgi:hypothetical protein
MLAFPIIFSPLSLAAAAKALGDPSLSALQDAISAFCGS